MGNLYRNPAKRIAKRKQNLQQLEATYIEPLNNDPI